ncbi:peptidoglycan DD-metalloendopeptidase family protein [Actinoplanes sp. TRM 88003]|uniref:Peptidoglycan DD-metalloendopeptidase family protein n=1 Tax=Paractinoplanes aksuensis TaxID=2939490 RepID=A0ABT1DQ51_9ACTN|nr:peptidoglycan DD-metalloendopeptidase family protein [Actinoplanes aksuensis]MCO8272957.1 peptidoglycan DD-metalloendopeptidase family protein [Actinoplanes aksuensis]
MWSKRRHRRKYELPALFAGLLLLAPHPAQAAPGNDADRAGKAVQRAEAVLEHATDLARTAARKLETATAAMPAAQKKVATSRGTVAAALAAAKSAGRKAATARQDYQKVAGRFVEARERVDDARERVDEIATASYMGSNFARLNVLVDATGPADMMARLSIVEQIMHRQQEDVDTLVVARRDARTEQDRAGLAKRAAEQAETEARDRLTAARAAQAAAERARLALEKLTQTRYAALKVANAQRSVVLARYEAAKAEEARIEAALRGYSIKSGDAKYGGGRLLMPVTGWKSSDYGERYDPYYRVWQLHAGMDIAAGGGSPIRAAAFGRVIRAGWAGGYGNYTCLSHGRISGVGFQTCYGHQSAILVRIGEYVRRGEVIGLVGTTGASTGNHLHFETRFDGAPRDPANYLPRCLC